MSITNLSVEASDLLARLRANVESEELRADGSRWGDTYLPNARPHIMPERSGGRWPLRKDGGCRRILRSREILKKVTCPWESGDVPYSHGQVARHLHRSKS